MPIVVKSPTCFFSGGPHGNLLAVADEDGGLVIVDTERSDSRTVEKGKKFRQPVPICVALICHFQIHKKKTNICLQVVPHLTFG